MTFPKLDTEPGNYDGEWFLGDRTVPGSIELRGSRPPETNLYGEPDGLNAAVRSFPERVELGELHGRLRRGDDVILGASTADMWLPNQTVISSPWAIVGMRLHELDELLFHRMSLQITGLDPLIGVMPIKHQRFPDDPFGADEATFSITLDSEAQLEWSHRGVTLQAGYQLSMAMTDGYSHRIRFAPNLTFLSEDGLGVDEWIERWVEPLRPLVAFATRQRQSLSWIRLEHIVGDGRPPEGDTISAQLFASGITQEPYEAQRPAWPHEAPQPIFTLAAAPRSPIELIERWRELDVPDNVFLRLYRLVLFQPELPNRARFLFLMQALESLHTRENEQAEREGQERHALERKEVLDHLAAVEIADADRAFIKKHLSKKPFGSLDERLRDVIAVAPAEEQSALDQLQRSQLGQSLADSDHTTPESWLRRLRNDLSHGNRHPPDTDLEVWAAAAELLCRYQVLRLLDVSL